MRLIPERQSPSAALSCRSICSDGNILCLYCPVWLPLAMVATEQLKCA